MGRNTNFSKYKNTISFSKHKAYLHIVLEEFWQVLVVEEVENFSYEDQRAEDDFEGCLVCSVFRCKRHRLFKQNSEGLAKAVQHEFDLQAIENQGKGYMYGTIARASCS